MTGSGCPGTVDPIEGDRHFLKPGPWGEHLRLIPAGQPTAAPQRAARTERAWAPA